jgi:hypothetical protein
LFFPCLCGAEDYDDEKLERKELTEEDEEDEEGVDPA